MFILPLKLDMVCCFNVLYFSVFQGKFDGLLHNDLTYVTITGTKLRYIFTTRRQFEQWRVACEFNVGLLQSSTSS